MDPEDDIRLVPFCMPEASVTTMVLKKNRDLACNDDIPPPEMGAEGSLSARFLSGGTG